MKNCLFIYFLLYYNNKKYNETKKRKEMQFAIGKISDIYLQLKTRFTDL